MFGPGQFLNLNLYPEVTKPVGGSCERASWVSHASASALLSTRADGLFSLRWVVGAFMSAHRTVYEIVSLFPVSLCECRLNHTKAVPLGVLRAHRGDGEAMGSGRRLMCRCWSSRLCWDSI